MNEAVAAVTSSSASAPSAATQRANRFAVGFWAAVILAAFALATAYVYYTIFSRFQPYDDEGFILISLKAFFQGKPLYDEVYSSFQPGFYVLPWALFTMMGWSLGHDSIRLLTLALWLAGASVNGLLTYRLTTSRLLGLAVALVSVRSLEPFANEPGHPQALAYLLVATVAALFAFADSIPPRRFAIAIGALTGLILLIKINVGIFILLPVVLLFAVGNLTKAAAHLRTGLSMLMILLPSVLWRTQLAARGTPVWTLFLLIGLAMAVVASYRLGHGRRADFPVRRDPRTESGERSGLASGGDRTLLRAGMPARRMLWLLVTGFLVCTVAVFQTSSTSVQSLPVFNAGLLTLAICAGILPCLELSAGKPQAQAWPWALLGWSAVVTVILGITLLRGTTLNGLANGLLWWPAKVSTSFLIRPRSNWLGPMLGLAGAASCLAYLWLRPQFEQSSKLSFMLSIAQIGFGTLVLAEFYLRRTGSSTVMPLRDDLPHFWMLPFAWLVGVPGQEVEKTSYGRLGLLAIAVMQPLIACPVAGTQLVPASMLLPVLGAVCLGNGLQSMRWNHEPISGWRASVLECGAMRGFWSWREPKKRRTAGALQNLRSSSRFLEIIGAAALLVIFGRETLDQGKVYAALTPLDLPGARRIRLTSEEVGVYHQIVSDLERPQVETFLTLPGLDSFYFWARKEPPNSLNVSAWIILLDEQSQEKIWQAAQRHSGLVVLRNRRLIRSWVGGRSVAKLALVRHIEENFETITNYGSYELMGRRKSRENEAAEVEH